MFGINIWQIIFAAIAFPLLINIGIIQFRQFEQRDFQPRNIEQRTIQQRQLSAARDLKGTWEGAVGYGLDFINSGSHHCFSKYVMHLVVNNQTDDTITGTVAFSNDHLNPGDDCEVATAVPTTPIPARASIGSSSISNIDFGAFFASLGGFSGSFTTDTITINQTTVGQFQYDNSNPYTNSYVRLSSPINLLRQK